MELTRRQFLKAGAVVGAHLVLPDPVKRLADTQELSIREALNGGVVRIYAGAAPSRPGLIDPGMMLSQITLEPFEFWKNSIHSRGEAPGDNIATGIATHFILESPSGKHKAVGSIGSHGANLNMSNTAVCSGGQVTIDTFDLAIDTRMMGIQKFRTADTAVEQFLRLPNFGLERLE